MKWLAAPTDFRAELRAALAQADAPQRFVALAALAAYRLTPLETIQLDRELGRVASAIDAAQSVMRLAVLSDATVDHLAPALRVAALRRGLRIEVYCGGFGQARNEVFDAASGLRAFEPDVVLLALGAEGAIAGVPLSATPAEADAACTAAVSDIVALWAALRERLDVAIVQQNFLDTSAPVFGSFDRLVPGAPSRLVEQLNAGLADACGVHGVALLDLARAAARDGRDAWFDRARWLQAKMVIAPEAAPRCADLVARILAAQRGLVRKCLVLDLDNTLWGGVIGDDGLEGIVLGEGSAVGEAYLALQRYAKTLAARGVILAVCSKNEQAVAEAAFRTHPEMILRLGDFAAFVVNWHDKAENLKAIAAQLNIGLDSLAFVDDNPAERARVRASLPMVAVPELPADPSGFVDCLADSGWFEAVTFTDDDRARSRYYADARQRVATRDSAQSLDDFLRGLEMVVEFGRVSPIQLERATQLINKTHQFNTTTRRLSVQQVAQYAHGADTLALQFRLADRLGDNGLVSVMLLRDGGGGLLDIDNWVMSCRVFGRGLENEILNIVVELARERGVRALEAEFVATDRNAVIADLFPRLGFSAVAGRVAGSHWRLDLIAHTPQATHIRRKAAA